MAPSIDGTVDTLQQKGASNIFLYWKLLHVSSLWMFSVFELESGESK